MSISLDAYAHGFPDTVGEEPIPVAVCEGCREDIFTGEEVLQLDDGTIVHDDLECLKKHTGAQTKVFEEEI